MDGSDERRVEAPWTISAYSGRQPLTSGLLGLSTPSKLCTSVLPSRPLRTLGEGRGRVIRRSMSPGLERSSVICRASVVVGSSSRLIEASLG